MPRHPSHCLVIACGALAREIAALRQANDWGGLRVHCLPAELHNRPERIPGAVRAAIREHRGTAAGVFVAYADCGTGGALDAVLAEEGAQRLPGAHCYELYTGAADFAALGEAEPGTFYLTDFLARHFERLVIRGLGIDRYPELAAQYFGNYRRLVYLAQRPADESLCQRAREAAQRLGLQFFVHHTGLEGLRAPLARFQAGFQPLAGPSSSRQRHSKEAPACPS